MVSITCMNWARNWQSWEKAWSQLDVVAATTSTAFDYKLWFDSDNLQTRWVVFPCSHFLPEVFWKWQSWVVKIVISFVWSLYNFTSVSSSIKTLMLLVVQKFYSHTHTYTHRTPDYSNPPLNLHERGLINTSCNIWPIYTNWHFHYLIYRHCSPFIITSCSAILYWKATKLIIQV